MGFFDLPTLAEVEAARRGRPIGKGPSRLERAVEKNATKAQDEKKLAAWAKAVKERDGWKDRMTGQKLKRTRELDPLRAEAHHVVSRENTAVRYDVRNGLCLSYATHDAVERHQLRIVGTRFFSVHGLAQRFIDCTFRVKFVKVKS